jgi:hypothetical protein
MKRSLFTFMAGLCLFAICACTGSGGNGFSNYLQTRVDVEVLIYSSEPALCAVSLGQGYDDVNPNLEVYRDSEITINGIPVPYFSESTYSIEFWNANLDLNAGDAVTVAIDNPSLGVLEITGKVPPSVTDGWMVGDVGGYLGGNPATVRMEWTPVDSSHYRVFIDLLDAGGQYLSASGIRVTDPYYVLTQEDLYNYEDTRASDIELSVRALNLYWISGCREYSQMEVYSHSLELYP